MSSSCLDPTSNCNGNGNVGGGTLLHPPVNSIGRTSPAKAYPADAGFITYKRRKYSKLPASSSSSAPLSLQMRSLHPLLEENGGVHLSYWKNTMESLIRSLGPCHGGLHGCIEDLLAHVKGQGNMFKSFHHKVPVEDNSNKLQNEKLSNSQVPDSGRGNVSSVINQYQQSFTDVICSDKFVCLCKLLCENFEGMKTGTLDFSVISSRSINGDYDHSLQTFASDFQQVWFKLKKIGEEMAGLADELLKSSQTADEKQKTSQLESSHTELLISNIGKQLSSDLSNVASKPEQGEACGLSRGTIVCHNCGLQLDVRNALICDGCEAAHHVSCIQPPVGEIPASWYCVTCLINGKTSSDSDCALNNSKQEQHGDCPVCKRLKDQTFQTCESEINFGDASLSLESEESPECSIYVNEENMHERNSKSHVCKRCKSGETDDMRFRICQHSVCPYKYYHKRCLRNEELRRCGSVWYCPSCVCRNCHFDKDDDKVTLCDGCDEAYHIYCIVPPLKSIPKGDWYCVFCTIEIKTRQRNARKLALKGLGAGSMDVLLTAAEKLHSER